jgi:hypothetical protein
MENFNGNGPNPANGDLSNFREAFSNYQKNQVKNKRKSKEEILAKYFVPRKTRETFRILPYRTKFFYVEAFFHVITVNAAGGKKKFGKVIYCPAHNDKKIQKLDGLGQPMTDGNGKPMMIPAPCPLCDKHKKILGTQDNSLKNIKKDDLTDAQKVIWDNNRKIFIEASGWEAKKFYIVKGIDMGIPKDGVKFWRFKHNFTNQGTLDKLFPVLDDFNTNNGVSFADPVNGTNLNIIMADTIMKSTGKTYKSISAITTPGKTPLHNDPLIVRTWLEDTTTWRDVFLPTKAPGITPYEFLEMCATGNNPYWDDSDTNNKHWVFPGRPDLEEKANTRKRNLDADEDENFELASDLVYGEKPRITIDNVTPATVGTYHEDAVDITAKPASEINPEVHNEVPEEVHEGIEDIGDVDYEDLPF